MNECLTTPQHKKNRSAIGCDDSGDSDLDELDYEANQSDFIVVKFWVGHIVSCALFSIIDINDGD